MALIVTSCVDSSPEGLAIELREIARYGWASGRPDPEGILPADAGMLGNVRALAVGPDERLYVLDADWNRIVAFEPYGDVEGVIDLSVGDGPGEVRFIRDLVVTPDGKLAVLDYERAQIVIFSPTGEFDSAIRLDRPRPMLFEMTDETIWVTTSGSPGSESPSLWVLSLTGETLRSGPKPDPQDVPFGQSISLAVAPDGSLLQSKARPGLWLRFVGSGVTVHGVELFPDMAPPEVTPTDYGKSIGLPRATAFGISTLPDGTVVQGHIEYAFDPSGEPILTTDGMRAALSFFTPDGELLGSVPFGSGLSGAWEISPESGHVFVAEADPYPVIVEYEIVGLL
jgi:hypothetical protein